MLIAAIATRGDLGLMTLSSFLQSLMWGGMSSIYWYQREQGKTSLASYLGSLDIWICTLLGIAWTVGFVIFLIGQCKKGFGGGPACRMLMYENSWMVVAAILFFIAAALAVSGRLVMLLSNSVDNLSGMLSFCMGALLAYFALLLTSVCFLVGRAALA